MLANALLALWIALFDADRIDLAGGHGPFILTPFLALTPIVALSEIARRYAAGRRIELTAGALGYAAVSSALICVALASVFVAPLLEVSASRAILLAIDIVGTLTIALLCTDRADLRRVMAIGAVVGLVGFAVFNVFETLWWFARGPETARFGPILVKFNALQNVGPLPRLAGLVADGNRGGFVLLCYFIFIWGGGFRPVARRLALGATAILLIMTVSRSATLGVLGTLVWASLAGRVRVSRGMVFAGALSIMLIAAAFLLAPRPANRALEIVSTPVTTRLNVSEGSAQSHLALVRRGLHEATASLSRVAIGFGYGDSYVYLQDFFPGNRYGSYHSLFVSMFAEAGILALIFSLTLSLVPLLVDGPWRALVAGSIAFNLFYQTNTEPVFWFVLALAWIGFSPRFSRSWNYLEATAG